MSPPRFPICKKIEKAEFLEWRQMTLFLICLSVLKSCPQLSGPHLKLAPPPISVRRPLL